VLGFTHVGNAPHFVIFKLSDSRAVLDGASEVYGDIVEQLLELADFCL